MERARSTTAPERRAAVVALVLAYVGMVVLCLPYAVGGGDVPGWLLLVGRWVPAAASATALLALGQARSLVRLWGLRAGGWRRLAVAYGAAVAVMTAALAVPALVVGSLAPGASSPADVWLAALPLLAGGGLVLAVSTLGEEVFWRGHLRAALRDLGFWRSSGVVGVAWVGWHLPLHAVYWVQGTLPVGVLVATTLGLLAWAPLLAALVERVGSVWPAVFAHAVPVASYQLLELGRRPDEAFIAVVVLHAVALLGAAWLLVRTAHPTRPRPRPAPAGLRR